MIENLIDRKYFVIIIALIFQIDSYSQTIFFVESKVIDKAVPRTSDSYQERFVRINNINTSYFIDKFHMTLFWQPISNDMIIGSKAQMCGLQDLNNQKLDTLFYNRNFEISGLTANSEKCYLTIHNSWLNESPDYNKAFNFYKYLQIDLNTKEIDTLRIFDNINARPIDLSPNGRFLSFFDYEYQFEKREEKYSLCIYDFQTDKISIIDSVLITNNEWYGDICDKSIGNWNKESDEYYFSKKDSDKQAWTIYSYSINTKSISKKINIPTERKCRFYAYEGFYYLLDQEKIVRLDSDKNEQLIYKRKYKYDYINSPIEVINK